MEDHRPPRRRRVKVTCPACQGLGRNGPEGSVCRVCWLTGVVDSARYERIKAQRAGRSDGSDTVADADGDPTAVHLLA